jgi:hypothetical protein
MIQDFKMVKVIISLLVIILSFTNIKKSNIISQGITQSSLSYLAKYKGHYPNNVKLLGNNPLTKRLKALLKSRYDFLIKTWGPETPIEIKSNTFIAWGCQQHNCSNTNFIIVVDFGKNVVYVGVREEEEIKIYSEDGKNNDRITNWATRNY